MRVICLDIESFFDSKGGYTLRKQTTEEYVRDPRFKMHLFSYWEPATMPQGPVHCLPSMLETNEELRRTIESSAVMCFHAHFDLLALSHWYGLKPAFVLDPLPMARLVMPGLKKHSLDALTTYFGFPPKNVPYHLFDGVRTLPFDIYAQVATGCVHDTRLMYLIFQALLPQVPRDELKVISDTVKMFSSPCLRLDVPRMTAFLKAERIRKAKAMLAAGEAIGLHFVPWEERVGPSHIKERLRKHLDQIEVELQSADRFKIALESLGVPCPMKPSPTVQGKMLPAIAKNDEPMKELLEHEDHRVQALAAARLGVKSTIDESRAERLIATASRGDIPIYLKPFAAKTLRFGGGDKSNAQNLPKQKADGSGGDIRKSLQAPEGHKIVVVDAGQIECRGVNHLAGERWVLDAFASGRDVYCETATRALSREVTPTDKPGRFIGKTLELGCGYGLGWRKYQRQMRQGMLGGPPVILSDDEAQNGVNTYRYTHPNVKALWNFAGKQVLPALASGAELAWGCLRVKDHKIYLPNGSPLDYTGMYWGFFGEQPQPDEEPQWWHPAVRVKAKYYGGKLVENVIQALWSGLFIRQAMNVISQRYKIVLQVHDEIVAVARDNEAEGAFEWMKQVLCVPPPWCPDIPLASDGFVSERYAR